MKILWVINGILTYLYILFTSSIVENILTIQLISFLNLVKYKNINLAWALFILILIWSSASAWWPLIVSRWQVIVNFSLSCCIFTYKKGYKLIQPKRFYTYSIFVYNIQHLASVRRLLRTWAEQKKSLTTRATNSNFKFTEPSCFNYLIS